jgi:hypothetical protein
VISFELNRGGSAEGIAPHNPFPWFFFLLGMPWSRCSANSGTPGVV